MKELSHPGDELSHPGNELSHPSNELSHPDNDLFHLKTKGSVPNEKNKLLRDCENVNESHTQGACL